MSTDLMLRFPDEATAAAALAQFRGDDAGAPVWLTASHAHALDPIGALDGAEGWHANLRLLDHPDEVALIEALTPHAVAPADPARVWA